MKIKPHGFSLSVRDSGDLERMSSYTLIKSVETYVLFKHNNRFIFLDSVKLRLYNVRTKWNLLDNAKFTDLIQLYEFFGI